MTMSFPNVIYGRPVTARATIKELNSSDCRDIVEVYAVATDADVDVDVLATLRGFGFLDTTLDTREKGIIWSFRIVVEAGMVQIDRTAAYMDL